MSGRHHTDWLSAYLDYTASLEAPEAFHFWTGISVLAGALRRKVWFSQKFFIWSPNFYITFVGPPGTVNKSTTVDIGMQLLRRIPGVKFGPNSLTWQALVREMQEAHEGIQFGNGVEVNIVEMSCLTVVGSEMGTLINPHDREMIDVFTDLWDGRMGTWRKRKVTGKDGAEQQQEIHNPWINMISCTTPAWLSGHVPIHMVDAGFFARTVFVYREKKRHLIAYPADNVPADIEQKEQLLLEDLERISLLQGEFTLTPEAKAWGVEWYEKHHTAVESNDPHLAALGTYASRKQTHLHKIAMVLAASQRDDLQITRADMERALVVLEEAERDMARVYSLSSDDREVTNANVVVEYIRKHGPLPRDLVYRGTYTKVGSYENFTRAINDAIMSQRIRMSQVDNRIIVEII